MSAGFVDLTLDDNDVNEHNNSNQNDNEAVFDIEGGLFGEEEMVTATIPDFDEVIGVATKKKKLHPPDTKRTKEGETQQEPARKKPRSTSITNESQQNPLLNETQHRQNNQRAENMISRQIDTKSENYSCVDKKQESDNRKKEKETVLNQCNSKKELNKTVESLLEEKGVSNKSEANNDSSVANNKTENARAKKRKRKKENQRRRREQQNAQMNLNAYHSYGVRDADRPPFDTIYDTGRQERIDPYQHEQHNDRSVNYCNNNRDDHRRYMDSALYPRHVHSSDTNFQRSSLPAMGDRHNDDERRTNGSDRLDRREEELRKFEATLNIRRTELDTLAENLSKRQSEINVKMVDLENRERDFKKRMEKSQLDIASLNKRKEELEKELKDSQNKFEEEKKRHLEEAKAVKEDIERMTIANKQEMTRALEKKREAMQKEVQSAQLKAEQDKNRYIQEANVAKVNLDHMIRVNERELARLQSLTAKKEMNLAKLNKAETSKKQNLSYLNKQIATKRRELDRAQSVVNDELDRRRAQLDEAERDFKLSMEQRIREVEKLREELQQDFEAKSNQLESERQDHDRISRERTAELDEREALQEIQQKHLETQVAEFNDRERIWEERRVEIEAAYERREEEIEGRAAVQQRQQTENMLFKRQVEKVQDEHKKALQAWAIEKTKQQEDVERWIKEERTKQEQRQKELEARALAQIKQQNELDRRAAAQRKRANELRTLKKELEEARSKLTNRDKSDSQTQSETAKDVKADVQNTNVSTKSDEDLPPQSVGQKPPETLNKDSSSQERDGDGKTNFVLVDEKPQVQQAKQPADVRTTASKHKSDFEGEDKAGTYASSEESSHARPRPVKQNINHPAKTYTDNSFYQKNYNMNMSTESAFEMQERLFREAAEKMRAQPAIHVASGLPSVRPPIISKPFIDISERYPDHWKWTDPYAVLGLPYNSSEKLVKSHYRKLAKIYHPDKSTSNITSDRFHAVTTAYQKIINDSTN